MRLSQVPISWAVVGAVAAAWFTGGGRVDSRIMLTTLVFVPVIGALLTVSGWAIRRAGLSRHAWHQWGRWHRTQWLVLGAAALFAYLAAVVPVVQLQPEVRANCPSGYSFSDYQCRRGGTSRTDWVGAGDYVLQTAHVRAALYLETLSVRLFDVDLARGVFAGFRMCTDAEDVRRATERTREGALFFREPYEDCASLR